MLEIKDNGAIYLTRGDSAYLSVEVEKDNKPYKTQTGDALMFSVKKEIEDTQYVIHKSFSVGQAIVINPEDTKTQSFGKYVYDVQLTTANGEVYTIVEPSLFYIKEEVTND